MKKLICSSLLAVILLLLSNDKATAQCGQASGTSAFCNAYSSFNADRVTEYGSWATNNTVFTISVNLQIFDETNPNRDAFASVVFGTYGWSQGINEGWYENSFSASGTGVQDISLFTTARCGSAYIGAEW